MNKLKKPTNVVLPVANSNPSKLSSFTNRSVTTTKALERRDHDVFAGPPQPRTSTEQYWASRAIAAESLLSARVAHQQELRAAAYREEIKRIRELSALNKANDEKHKALERLVLILLACVVALTSAVIYLAARSHHRVQETRPWWASPSHFTIPILSPFTSVVEQETSTIGTKGIAVFFIAVVTSIHLFHMVTARWHVVSVDEAIIVLLSNMTAGCLSCRLILWSGVGTSGENLIAPRDMNDSLGTQEASALALGMRIASYNLRFDSKPDNITVQQTIASLPDPLQAPRFLDGSSERPWSTRRIRVAEILSSEGIVLAGFQEALIRQVRDLAELFGNDWSWIGVGRDDGVQAGEFSPIFFKKSVLTLRSNDSFWTSNTPFEPSKFPGAGSFRVVTAARFTLTGSAVPSPVNFSYLNTHLDDQSDDQRKLAASMLLIRARFEAVNTGSPVIVTGDFNSPPLGSDSGAYNIITGAAPPVPVNATFAAKFAVRDDQMPDFKMIDLRRVAPRENVSANFATFTGFTSPSDTSDWTRIDFIFGGSNLGWSTDGYKVGTSLADDGVLASDHRPVFADLSF